MRLLPLLLLILLATSCGFRPRAQLTLPPELASLRVQGADPYSPLQRNLEQALRRAGATLVDRPGSAVLRVSRNRIDRLPLSVGDTGRVQEYLMRYSVEFELVGPGGDVVLPSQSVVLERDYSFDTFQALGTPGEEELVKAELERDMVQAILRRIDAATRAD